MKRFIEGFIVGVIVVVLSVAVWNHGGTWGACAVIVIFGGGMAIRVMEE